MVGSVCITPLAGLNWPAPAPLFCCIMNDDNKTASYVDITDEFLSSIVSMQHLSSIKLIYSNLTLIRREYYYSTKLQS